MVDIRKSSAGQAAGRNPDRSVWTYTWDEPGAVVDVANEHVGELLAIPHNDFAVVQADDAATPQDDPDPEPDGQAQVTEPGPAPGFSEAPTPRKRTAKKTAPAAGEGADIAE